MVLLYFLDMLKTCNALCPILFFKFIIVVAPHKSEKRDHLEHNDWVKLKATNLQVTRKNKIEKSRNIELVLVME